MFVERIVNRKALRINETLSVVLKVILVISIINSIYYGYWYLMSTNILLLVLLMIPYIVRKSHKVEIPKEFEFLLLVFVLVMIFSGTWAGVVTPIIFGIAIGFVGFLFTLILYSNSKISKDTLFILLFSFCLSITAGFSIELVKYYLKVFLDYSISDGNYVFSMNMMSYVTLGALISSGLGVLYLKRKLNVFGKIIHKIEKLNPSLYLRKKGFEEVKDLISKGESKELEFKETLRFNVHTNEIDKRIEQSALKTICAFLNSDGGTLLVGVSDNGEIKGLERDGFQSNDKFGLHLTNLIKNKIGRRNLSLVRFEIVNVEGKDVVRINCALSKKPVFVREDSVEGFYVRSGPASVKLEGSALLDYVEKKF